MSQRLGKYIGTLGALHEHVYMTRPTKSGSTPRIFDRIYGYEYNFTSGRCIVSCTDTCILAILHTFDLIAVSPLGVASQGSQVNTGYGHTVGIDLQQNSNVGENPTIFAMMNDDHKSDDKETFEEGRDKILSDLPDALKDQFGAIGFFMVDDDDDDSAENNAEESRDRPTYYQPVLIVNPFEVAPKPVRDIYWMDIFNKAKRSKGKMASLDYLVYVYGSDDPDDCYNFVSQEDFISLESAREHNIDVPPAELAGKAVEDLTEVEVKLLAGHKEMQEDLAKERLDRKPHSKFPFLERYEEREKNEAAGPPSKKSKR